jgi:hypothetical protein
MTALSCFPGFAAGAPARVVLHPDENLMTELLSSGSLRRHPAALSGHAMSIRANRYQPESVVRWSIVLPVFNEPDFLPRTLASLAKQSVLFRLIVVDNGLTDGCIAEARALAESGALDALFLSEPQPGQVHALR